MFGALLAALCLIAPVAIASAAPQSIPNGLKRTLALENDNLDTITNGLDDKRVDVDVAVVDSGIDLENPDLNVVEGVDCLAATAPGYACTENPGDGDDGSGHGTGVALRLAALDNGIQEGPVGVGVAAGARLWALKAAPVAFWGAYEEARKLWSEAKSWTAPVLDLNPSIAAVKWATEHADQIEVLHYAGYCTTDTTPNLPQAVCPGGGQVEALEAAIDAAVKAGLVVVVPAGNWHREINGKEADSVPARNPKVITVSALFDSDGLPGGKGPEGKPGTTPPDPSAPCNGFFATTEKDDTSSDASHYGDGIDIVAPWPCTSGAAPHVSGAAALLASTSAYPTDDEADVVAIGSAIVNSGNKKSAAEGGWDDESGDESKEPLLDLSSEAVFAPKYVHTYLGPAPNAVMPEVVEDPATGKPCAKLEIDWPEVSGGCVVEDVTAGTFTYRTQTSCYMGGGMIEIGEMHVGPDGFFAVEDVNALCNPYGAERCDVEPNDSLHYFPERKAKNSLHLPPWTGAFFKVNGVAYAYLSLCLTVTQAGPEAKWADFVLAKLGEVEYGEETAYEWEFASSGSKAWETGPFGYFYADAWWQPPGAVIDW